MQCFLAQCKGHPNNAHTPIQQYHIAQLRIALLSLLHYYIPKQCKSRIVALLHYNFLPTRRTVAGWLPLGKGVQLWYGCMGLCATAAAAATIQVAASTQPTPTPPPPPVISAGATLAQNTFPSITLLGLSQVTVAQGVAYDR